MLEPGAPQSSRGFGAPVAFVSLDLDDAELSSAALAKLDRALDAAQRDASVRAVVLEISGCSDFSARELLALETRADADALWVSANRVADRLRGSRPVVAALRGAVDGAGLELALACSARVCDETFAGAMVQVRRGLVPWLSGLPGLARLCGHDRALGLVLSGERIAARRALTLGIVSEVVSSAELLAAAERAARSPSGNARREATTRALPSLISTPAQAHALAIARTLQSAGPNAAREVERKAFGALAVSGATRCLLDVDRAASSMRKCASPSRRAPSVTILGATSRGANLAARLHAAGAAVRLAMLPLRSELTSDVVVDATTSDLATKRALVASFESLAPDHSILAIDTSTLRLSDIVEKASIPGRVVGAHLAGGVLELTTTNASAAALERGTALGHSLGALAVRTGDGAGRLTTRLRVALVNEALLALDDGATPDEIAGAALDWGFEADPFTMLRDAGASRVASDAADLGKTREDIAARCARLARAERIPRTPRKIRHSLERRKGAVALEVLQMRCALAFVNEAFHCLDEGIVSSVPDADLLAIHALGFPAFRGGPFAYSNFISPQDLVGRLRALEILFGARFSPAAPLIRSQSTRQRG